MKKENEGVRFIYTLSHPITKEIRYIGQTKNLENRLNVHINDSKIKTSYVNKWINSLVKTGLKPVMEILEECNNEDIDDNEILYIALFKSGGFRLTNSESGGCTNKTISIESGRRGEARTRRGRKKKERRRRKEEESR